MAETLYELLNRCTVRIVVPATQEQGTGFFVAPGQVVTCAHVVKGAPPDAPVQLFWRAQQDQPFQELSAQVRLKSEAQDVALLVVESALDHPCAWLAEESAPFQELYSFGYPQHLAAGGTSVRFTCEGWTERDEQTLLTLTDGQVVPGMSGAPVLSRQTGQVCGLLAITRDQGSNLGGRAILTRTLWQVVPALQDAQAAWKQQDQRWRICLEAHRQSLRQSTIGDGTGGQASRPRDYLPLPPNPLFQERPGEFAELERLLFDRGQPARLGLVGVVGMGGVGKTQLAVELGVRYRERFPAGIFWMPATGQTLYEWQRQLALLAERTEYLPSDDTPGQPDTELRRAKHFATYLAEHTGALLILDNVEQPALVASALPTLSGNPQPACTLLYTSRVPVKPDERVSLHRVETLLPEAALRLLLAEARPAVLEAALTDSQSGEARAARDLCQMVGFLPLGLIHLRRLLARTPTLTLTRLVEGVRGRGALEIAKYEYTDAKGLFATFLLSWEQVQDPRARQLFYLAGYFPEATPIPLWLLGLAAGLGERSDPWEPLGEVCQILYELSLLELLAEGQARLHPLVREFSQRLVKQWRDQGQGLKEQASARLVADLLHLTRLEQRAQQEGYWGCLEQVRAAAAYAALLGADQQGRLGQLERWLDRENPILGAETFWQGRLPGLFYQQLYNRIVEEEQQTLEGAAPAQWLRQLAPTGAQDGALLRIFAGHQGEITSVAFSPDDRFILTGATDKIARLWDTNSGKMLLSYEGHQDAVTSIAFSPDGQQVLTGSLDRTLRVWDTKSGELRLILKEDLEQVSSVAFSPDGRQVLTGSSDAITRLWETPTGRLLGTFLGHQKPILSVAFSPDGSQILTGSADCTARLWDISSGALLRVFKTEYSVVTSIAFAPDGTKILTGSQDGVARLWDIGTGRLIGTLTGHQRSLESLAFSSDTSKVLPGSKDGTARLWWTSRAKLVDLTIGSETPCATFSPDGRFILTGAYFHAADLWESDTGSCVKTFNNLESDVGSVAFSPSGHQVLLGCYDGVARTLEVASG